MSDFDLGSEAQASSTGKTNKYDYKELYLKLTQGDNIFRLVSIQGKKLPSFWCPADVNGKSCTVYLPENLSPDIKRALIDKGFEYGKQIKDTMFMKAVDRFGKMKVFKFNQSQIKSGLKTIKDLLETDDRAITQVDVNVKRGPEGSKPLYTVAIAKLDPEEKKLREKAIQKLIEEDTMDLNEIVRPWTEKKIREQILGEAVEGGDPAPKAPVKQSSASVAPKATAKKAVSGDDDQDFTVFDDEDKD
jgi:hypothetical protein